MALTIENSGPLLSQDEINTIEVVLGLRLPFEYKLFLSKNNGGHPEPSCFSGVGDEVSFSGSCIHYFYGVGDEAPHVQILRAFNIFKGRIPKGLIPIADDPFGNQICIVTEGNEIGIIYFWDHENKHSPPTFRNMYNLAPSFDDFISHFFEIERPWETELDRAVRKNDVETLQRLLDFGADLEKEDQWGRTLMENAALANSLNVMKLLFAQGATLRNARAMVEENILLVPELAQSLALLSQMEQQQ